MNKIILAIGNTTNTMMWLFIGSLVQYLNSSFFESVAYFWCILIIIWLIIGIYVGIRKYTENIHEKSIDNS